MNEHIDNANDNIKDSTMNHYLALSCDELFTSLEHARKFLSRLYDFHYEEKCNEMLPEWKQMLLDSMSLIKEHIDYIP